MRPRVADVLIDALVAAGVKRVYGVSGDSLNGVTDSIRPRREIEWIHVRHEETAAFAAGAEAHLTGHRRCARAAAVPATCTDQRPVTVIATAPVLDRGASAEC
jgi:thiamine pyrophosphate-dependent acetolactate synthase large subunit-like protein